MAEIGSAYFTLMPSMKGVSAAINKGLSGVDASTAGQKIGGSLGKNISTQLKATDFGASLQSFGKSLSSIGNSLTTHITKPALIAGTAVAGIAFAKGFSRLTAIDSARAKLTALGHDADSVSSVMDSALAAVKGTSYGLDEAATAAASAAAAGISQGEDLTRYLKLVGDAAAISGRSMADMGSIFGKVQTAGRASMYEINMLADSGIPIFQYLADEIGVSADEIRDLASAGKISSETFLSAIEKNIGGAAKIIGESSFTGALANVWAAIGRIGANFLDAGGSGGGFFSQMKPLMVDFMGVLEGIEAKAADFGVVFGGAFKEIVTGIKDIIPFFNPLSDGLGDVESTSKSVADSISSFFSNLKNLLSGVNDFLAPLGTSIGKLAPLIAGVAVAAGPVFSVLGTAIGGIGAAVVKLTPVFGSLGQILFQSSTPVTALGRAFSALLGPIGIVIGLIATLIAVSPELRSALGDAFGQIMPVIQQIVEVFMSLASTIMSAVMPVLQQVGALVAQVVTAIAPLITMILSALLPVIQQIATTVGEVLNAIMPIIDAALAVISAVVATVVALINGDWSAAWNSAQSIFSTVWDLIQSIVSGAISVVQSVISGALNAISSLWSSIWNQVSSTVSGIWESVKSTVSSGVSGVISTISGLPGQIMGFFADAGSWLIDAGASIIQGLADGISGAVGAATGAISNVLGQLRAFLPFSPAKKGPFSGKGWTLYSGRAIVEALADGIASQTGLAVNSMASVMDDMSNQTEWRPDSTASFSSRTLAEQMGGVGSTTNYNLYLNDLVVNDDEAIREKAYALIKELIRKGRT